MIPLVVGWSKREKCSAGNVGSLAISHQPGLVSALVPVVLPDVHASHVVVDAARDPDLLRSLHVEEFRGVDVLPGHDLGEQPVQNSGEGLELVQGDVSSGKNSGLGRKTGERQFYLLVSMWKA